MKKKYIPVLLSFKNETIVYKRKSVKKKQMSKSRHDKSMLQLLMHNFSDIKKRKTKQKMFYSHTS